MPTKTDKQSDERFYNVAKSEQMRSPPGWYYRAREGVYGPFESRDVALQHFSTTVEPRPRGKGGLFKQLISPFLPEDHGDTAGATGGGPTSTPGPGGEQRKASWHTAEPAETDAFDRPARLMAGMASDHYRRLPQNKAVRLDLVAGQPIELYLAGYRFLLQITEDNLTISDQNARVHLLVPGTSTIGRSADNDVVTSRNFKEVSRLHLIIDWHSGEEIQLTDVSTLGTFVLPGQLPEET